MSFGNHRWLGAASPFTHALLDEIRIALRHVRRHTPASHLADLAESKLQELEARLDSAKRRD